MSQFPAYAPCQFPPRQWGIFGYAGVGKTTFLTQMKQPLLVIDADGHFDEILTQGAHTGCEALRLFSDTTKCRDVHAIGERLKCPDLSGVGTVVLDSLTPFIRLLNATTMFDNNMGLNKNRVSPHAIRASAMRILQDSVIRPGVDSAVVWHEEDARDGSGKAVTNQSLSVAERKRLTRSLNAVIELVCRNGQRKAIVRWSRTGTKGVEIIDSEGGWRGVPERIEAALYPPSASPSSTPAAVTA